MTCKMIRKPKGPGGRSGQIVMAKCGAPAEGSMYWRECMLR